MTNIFNGVPHNHQASGLFPSDPTITYFFYYDGTINKVYKHNSTSNTTTIHDIGSGANQLFPTLPTNQAMNRAVADGGSLYIKWQDPSTGYIQTRYSSPTLVGTGATPTPTDDNIHDARTANTSYAIAISPTRMIVRLPLNSWATDHQYNQGSWGGTATPYTGLPQTGHRSINMIIGFNAMVNVFYDTGIVYTIDLSSQAVVSSAPYGSVAPQPNPIFFGVPHNHQASGLFPSDPTNSYFFYYDGTINKVYKHDSTSNTTTIHDIGSGANQLFPGLPTNQAMDRALFTQNVLYVKWKPPTGSYIQIRYTNSTTASGGQISSPSDVDQQARTSNNSYSVLINSANTFAVQLPLSGFAIDHLYTTGNWGGTTTPYNGLPQTLHRSMALIPGNNNQVLVFYDTGIVYTIDLSTQVVVSSAPYGATIPPTPLPDIEIVYSAPSQFNLFSSDVALVTETQYGWNFTKTILTADKMELYLYHSSAAGAIAFNYDQLRDIKINMKNNLVLPAGEIFVTIWTGPPTAPNWYNYKDIYNMTPALGTTLDVDLVETILTLSDTRTDPILAIALHSDSSQQQVNCDVERVSFEVLLPTTNETQRVIVKLQNNFVFVDDKYWDFDQILNGYNNASLIGGWQLSNFSPNIVAGNFPQSVTANTEVGNAWFIDGTFQYYETTDGTTWTASTGKTITFENAAGATPPPGKASNGYAYTGCSGIVTQGSGWGATIYPVSWTIEASGQLDVIWVGKSADNYLSLSQLGTPNNFTLTNFQSGMFDANATPGSTAVGVFIGATISPAQQPTAPIAVDISVVSETELTIKRSWELTTTTYLLNPSDTKSVLGQYSDPAFTTTLAPNTFTGADNLVVVVEPCPSPIQLLFSGGFINTIDVSGTYNINVNAPPVGITYVWTANYYDVNNVLISAVAGAGTSGTQSNFTIDLLTMPSNAKYVFYTCTSNEGADAVISIILIQAVVPTQSFALTFSGGLNNQISANGTYSVAPSPVDATSTYAYTAVFKDISGTSLGAVPNAGASGTSSSFAITYASLPANVAYIDYNATATGGGQGGEVSQLSITIIEPCPVCPACDSCCPAVPGNDDVELIRSTTGNIEYTQYNPTESLKLLTGDRLGELKMSLVDSYGDILHTDKPVYYECEVRSTNSGGGSITES